MNKVVLSGRLGRDPELKPVNGGYVVNIRIATKERGYTRQDGTKVEDRTDWHHLVAFGGLAKYMDEVLMKGDNIFVCGKLRTNQWETSQGDKRTDIYVAVDEFEILGRKAPVTQASNPSQPMGKAPVLQGANDLYAFATEGVRQQGKREPQAEGEEKLPF